KDVLTTTADASATGDTSGNSSSQQGFGIAAAINVADRTNVAYIAGTSPITGKTVAIEVLAPDQSEFTAQSTSGIGNAQSLAIAGSVSLNFVFDHNKAYLANSANVTLTGSPDVTIEADSNIAVTSTAKPSDGKGDPAKTGAGISVAIGYEDDTTSAYI